MKSLKLALLLSLALLPASRGEEARFFRISGPVTSTITAFSSDGYVTWTNAPTNVTLTVQSAVSLIGPSNWVDYIQVPVTNPATTHRLYDPNPPAGMALIPAGTFTMGNCMATNEGSAHELPMHTVYVSACYMDRYEVTKGLWDDVYHWATNQGYSFGNSGLGKAVNHPVHTINWYDMVKWCNARSQKEGLGVCYYTDASQTTIYKTGQLNLTAASVKWGADGYRLPTEAEWEKAARGGAGEHRFPWVEVETITHGRANYYSDAAYAYDINPTPGYHPMYSTDGSPYTSPVGSFAPNGYGLYDMAGNVGEWCWDWYVESWYSNPAATQNDTRGPNGVTARVQRGDGWNNYAFYARCADRGFYGTTLAVSFIGFRCVRRL